MHSFSDGTERNFLGRVAADFGGGSYSSSDAISTAARRRNRRPSDVEGRTSQFLFPHPLAHSATQAECGAICRRNASPSGIFGRLPTVKESVLLQIKCQAVPLLIIYSRTQVNGMHKWHLKYYV
ncbi:hypothetical protein CDAR_14921 [Caerostris darwini]|uniref:Uncharacterized protein n=1 Tax=Caerostris darwini TaxID=1538125 RepID=A0AAV4W7W0_9ARAC|nr:hypothetical protein CDAR_14921 [Caerostris darwini]